MNTVMREVLAEQRRTREQQEKTNALLEQLISMNAGAPLKPTVELRDLSDADARVEITAVFDTSDSDIYYSDICDRTRLPLEQVVRVCNQLMSEGKIGVGGRG